jgi:hypothetical protein
MLPPDCITRAWSVYSRQPGGASKYSIAGKFVQEQAAYAACSQLNESGKGFRIIPPAPRGKKQKREPKKFSGKEKVN